MATTTKWEVVERIIDRCIKDKTWRSECEKEATAWATKADRKAVLAKIEARYKAAGALFTGRWA